MVRQIVLEADTRYRAAFLTQLSAGFGVEEFVRFSREWWKYAEAIRAKTVPTKVNMIRKKTAVSYWSLLWDDAIEALTALLLERERALGRKLGKDDFLFVDRRGVPLETDDLQNEMRRLADRTGLDPKVPGKKVYLIRPHELRDTFKTLCENSEVPDKISEFLMGHEIDPLEYNKFAKTDEGEQRIRMAVNRARPKLNVLTRSGEIPKTGTSYYETTLEILSVAKGIPYDQLKNRLTVYAKRMKDYERIRQEAFAREGKEPEPIDVARRMTREELFPAFSSMVRDMEEEKRPTVPNAPKFEYHAFAANEYNKRVEEGWEPVGPVNSTSYSFRRVKEKDA